VSAAPPRPGRALAAWTLAITLAIQSMVSMALLVMPVLAPTLAGVLGISPVYIGTYVALVYAAALVTSLAGGAAVARFGAMRVSQGALLLSVAGLLLCTVPWLPAIALGGVFVGLGYGPVTPASSHLLARTTAPERMSLVFSIKQTGVPVGGMLAGALVPGLELWVGWQGALLAVAAVCALVAWAAQPLRAALDGDRDPQRSLGVSGLAQPIRLVLSQPALRRLAAGSFVFSTAQLSLTTYLVTYLTGSLNYGLVAAGLVMSASQLGGVVGRVLWGWVADRWLGAARMLAVLAALMAASTAATAWLGPGSPAAWVLVVVVVFGASAVGWNGVYLAEVARQAPPGLASVATGGTLAITFLGVVIGPPLFGALAGVLGGYGPAYLALAPPTAACVLLFVRRARPA
jgi:predicted MFS family arabinose efflux permease